MEIINSIRDEVKALANYSAGQPPKKGGRSQIKLASNENRWGASPKALTAIESARNDGLAVYPDSKMKALRQAVADFWKRRGCEVEPESILFGDGSGEVLNMVIALFVKDGDIIVTPEKSFSLYALLSAPKGAKVVKTGRKTGGDIDLDAMTDAIIKYNPKIAMFANPDNPVSTLIALDRIEAFLKKVPPETAILLDEAYIHFAGLEHSAIGLMERFPNLILMYTFSKAYGLAGLRVGYALMHPELEKQIEKIRLPFNLGNIQQAGAIAALEDEDFLKMTVGETQKQRIRLTLAIRELGAIVPEPYGNFILRISGRKRRMCMRLWRTKESRCAICNRSGLNRIVCV